MAPKDSYEITPELLLHAYASGIFPMSDSQSNDSIYWVDPHERGILPLEGFHISRSLARRLRREPFRVTINTCFRSVVTACADRSETWINAEIFDLYSELHDMGFAHSVEVFDGETLVGGLYGVALGAAFFGESMFSLQTDTSKIALAYLVDRLRAGGFLLLDTQFVTDHLRSLGGIEIGRSEYHTRLDQALSKQGDFHLQLPTSVSGAGILQRSTQTS